MRYTETAVDEDLGSTVERMVVKTKVARRTRGQRRTVGNGASSVRVVPASFPVLIGRWLVAGARHSPETRRADRGLACSRPALASPSPRRPNRESEASPRSNDLTPYVPLRFPTPRVQRRIKPSGGLARVRELQRRGILVYIYVCENYVHMYMYI